MLAQLEGRQGQLTPAAEDYLTTNASKLSQCSNPFKQPASASRTKVDSGKVTASDGTEVKLGSQERELAKQVADKLVLDEVEAALLLRAYRRSRGEDDTKDVHASLRNDTAFWESMTGFVFEERLSILLVVTHLLRKGKNASSLDYAYS